MKNVDLGRDIPWQRIPWGKVALIVLVFFLLGQLSVMVPAGHRVVMFNSLGGVEHRAVPEGLNLKLPFIENPVVYDVRTNTYTMSATHDEGDSIGDDAMTALTNDGQTVKVDVSVQYHPEPNNVWRLHQHVGPDYVSKIIRPISQMTVRDVISQHSVSDVYSEKRDLIQSEVEHRLRKAFNKYQIGLDALLIRNISFSQAYANAIEQKQVALQEAERMRYVLQKEEAERKRKIIEANGDAEAIRQRGEALRQNPRLVEYEYVQKIAPNIKAIVADQKNILSLDSTLFKD